MTAFCGEHVIIAIDTQKLCNTQSCAGTDYADYALRCQRTIRPRDMKQIVIGHIRNRVRDRRKIVHHAGGIDAELLVESAGLYHPAVVRHAHGLAGDGTGNGYRSAGRQRLALSSFERLSCGFQARMVGGFLRHFLRQLDRTVVADSCNGEAGVRAADIDRNEFHYNPAAASMALPPFSASSAEARNIAKNSRPVPLCEARAVAGVREERSAVVESSPVLAHSFTTSPSRSSESGP